MALHRSSKSIRHYRFNWYRPLAHVTALYDGEIAYVDHHLGRLLKELESTRLDQETGVVVTSDHGEEFYEHGSLEGHQWTLYEEVVAVPLIIRLPGQKRGAVIEDLVSTVSVAGTILDIAGVQSKRSRKSLFGALKTGSPESFDHGEAFLDLTVRNDERTIALRTATTKLIRNADSSIELYVDPAPGKEHDNVAKQSSDIAKDLSNRINTILKNLSPLDDRGRQRQSLDDAARERLRATGYLQ